MKIKKSLSAFVIVLVAIIAIVLFLKHTPCSEPERPSGIPKTAIWNGGCDGGYWVELVEIKDSKYRFRIYLDYKAEIVMDADFIFKKDCGITLPKDESILKLITIVHEDMILLHYETQDCVLQPIYPAYGGSTWEIIKEKGSIK